MESKTLDASSICSFTTSSSWPIVRGSVDDAVTFESSISAADSDSAHAISPKRKTPLILRRPSPDSVPCEITIRLAHEHEIRQVYARSSARVYEIYHTGGEKDGSEYLCTVRCGLAAQNNGSGQVTEAVGSMPASYPGSKCREERHSRTESGSSVNEDGWVDVDPSGLVAGDCSPSIKIDLYEATAEISDGDPVMSVTLRFLSIQSGEYIHIDEIYIYADPVIMEDTDSSPSMPENSSGSTLMSMLVPTLLQLSKSRMMTQTQQQNDNSATERRESLAAGHKLTSAAGTSNVLQSESIPNPVIGGASKDMSQAEFPVQRPDPQNRPYSTAGDNRYSGSHIEGTLDELVCRISRIEHFCSRFEENMLKPISSMEARLQRVEQQLESFFENSESCKAASSRISASVFPCNDAEFKSSSVNANNNLGHTRSDSMKSNDSCQEEISTPSEASSSANAVRNSDEPDSVEKTDQCHEEAPVLPAEAFAVANEAQPSEESLSACASQLHPSLIVTAPDFSSSDDEEENCMIERVKESPKDSSKKPLSIDDALASALAGFLSLASTCPNKSTNMAGEAASDIPTVEKSDYSSSVAVVQDVDPAVLSVNVNESNEPFSISQREGAVTEGTGSPAADNGSEEITETVGQCHLSEEEDRQEPVDIVSENEGNSMEDSGSSMELGSVEVDDGTSQALVSDVASMPVLDAFLSKDESVVVLELPGVDNDTSSGEEAVTKGPGVLRNILGLHVQATVNFEIPVLDVKFSSLVNSSANSPLEVLLTDTCESHNEIISVKEEKKNSPSEQTDLVIIEDEVSASCETSSSQSFFLNDYDSSCLSSKAEEELLDHHDYVKHDENASLI